MTDDKTALRALLEQGSDAGFPGEMIGFAAERLMELEVSAATSAHHGERGPGRLVQRNGDRDRTAPGRLSCAFPGCARELLPGFSGAETDSGEGADGGDPGSLCPGGLDVQRGRVVHAVGCTGVSKSQVSRLCAEVDERVGAFLAKLIEGG